LSRCPRVKRLCPRTFREPLGGRRSAFLPYACYVVDPNGYGVEVLYELPREVWGDNIQGAIDYAEPVPTEGDEAFIDDTNYPMFGTAERDAE
jgi:hypothetical protein